MNWDRSCVFKTDSSPSILKDEGKDFKDYMNYLKSPDGSTKSKKQFQKDLEQSFVEETSDNTSALVTDESCIEENKKDKEKDQGQNLLKGR